MEWVVPRKAGFRRTGFRRSAAPVGTDPITVVNLSTVGLGIVAPTVDAFVPGRSIEVRFGELTGTVAIRWRSPGPDEATTYYGCELVRPTHEFIEGLMEVTDISARATLEELWNQAH